MSKIDDGGAAFPLHLHGDYAQGMTLRDYFAAAALPLAYANWKEFNEKENDGEEPCKSLVSEEAYDFADAMIAARKEGA